MTIKEYFDTCKDFYFRRIEINNTRIPNDLRETVLKVFKDKKIIKHSYYPCCDGNIELELTIETEDAAGIIKAIKNREEIARLKNTIKSNTEELKKLELENDQEAMVIVTGKKL